MGANRFWPKSQLANWAVDTCR